MRYAFSVWVMLLFGLAAASTAHAGEVGTQDTLVVVDVPAPEPGVIRVHFGAPVGIRPGPAVRHPSPSPSQTATPAAAAPAYRPSSAPPSSPRSPLSWLESTARGPALIFLSDDPALPPDTLYLTETVVPGGIGRVDAPPITGIGVPDELRRATVNVPEREAIERMLLDEGYFRALTVQFEFDRATLMDVSDPVLGAIADVLNQHPEMRLEVGGHTDNVGVAAYNRQLSELRAESVRQDLIGRGIDAERLEAIGYGEESPLLPNRNETHRALNRRVEFRVIDPRPDPAPQPPPEVDDGEILDTLEEALRQALRESLRSGSEP